MRISDWSSDVCSSDLPFLAVARAENEGDLLVIQIEALQASLVGLAVRQENEGGRIFENRVADTGVEQRLRILIGKPDETVVLTIFAIHQIGRASGRERVCKYV